MVGSWGVGTSIHTEIANYRYDPQCKCKEIFQHDLVRSTHDLDAMCVYRHKICNGYITDNELANMSERHFPSLRHSKMMAYVRQENTLFDVAKEKFKLQLHDWNEDGAYIALDQPFETVPFKSNIEHFKELAGKIAPFKSPFVEW